MILNIENIGFINKADIEIAGMTVVAGPNNTGKSTIGKVLYTIFNGLYNIDGQIEDEKKSTIVSNLLNRRWGRVAPLKDGHQLDELLEKISNNNLDIEFCIDEFISSMDRDDVSYIENKQDIIKNIKIAMNIPDEEYRLELLNRRFADEFDGQINNVYLDSAIKGQMTINVKGKEINIGVANNLITSVTTDTNIYSRAVYIDEPYMLDDMMFARYVRMNHRSEMKRLLMDSFRKEIGNNLVVKERISNVINVLSNACNGRVVRRENRLYYADNNKDEYVSVRNMSTGLKSMSILRELLEREVIQSKGVLILDEPEVHLHPQWQILFAEALVLLQKEYELHILLNTHSPYFINAIEVYSKKYAIENVCKYYLASDGDNGIIFKDVTQDRADIYDLLAHPFQTLENEEFGE